MLYDHDKHFICRKCFQPEVYDEDIVILPVRQYTIAEGCCLCGLPATTGAIIMLDIEQGRCRGNHLLRGPGLQMRHVESNLPYFERMIAKWATEREANSKGAGL